MIVNYPIYLFCLLILTEYGLLKLKRHFKLVNLLAYLQIILLIFSSLILLFYYYDLTIIVGILTVYRITNLYFHFNQESNPSLKLKGSLKTSLNLGLIQLALILIQLMLSYNLITNLVLINYLSIIILIILIGLSWKLVKTSHKLKPPRVSVHYYDKDLPTVSVLIPARN